MNKAIVNPMPADVATPTIWRSGRAIRPVGKPAPSPYFVVSTIPTGLPITRAAMIAQVIGERIAALHEIAGERQAGVGQGEQRHDHVARPRVQHVLEPFDDRHRSASDVGGQLARSRRC